MKSHHFIMVTLFVNYIPHNVMKQCFKRKLKHVYDNYDFNLRTPFLTMLRHAWELKRLDRNNEGSLF